MTTLAPRLALASILALLTFAGPAMAQRGRGGGGMVGRAGGGGFRGGGGGGGGFRAPSPAFRPTPNNFRPNFERPANVNREFSRPNEFRPNVNQNVNRGNVGNINRENINRGNVGNVNNVNRQTFVNNGNINRNNINNNNININRNNFANNNYRGGYGGYGGYGANRGWGGYGGNYYANRYYGYHQGWVNGPWSGGFLPGWGGYGYGYGSGYGFGYPGFYGGLGLGLGIGAAAWGLGSLVNGWGYSQYANPYYSSIYGSQPAGVVAQATGGYDYSMPLNLTSAPPADEVFQTTEESLGEARQAFHDGDYARALSLADGALRQTPNDPMLHEFRAVCLFAMGRFDEAAVPFYAVLTAGPGWDWTTMIGLYPDIETYTRQLRALEAFCEANPRAASARFVLAALYLTQGSTGAAATRLREVVAIQPQDKLSAQLLTTLTSAPPGQNPNQGQNPAQANATAPGAPPSETPPANPNPEPQLPTGPVPANLIGAWTATPAAGVSIALNIDTDKTFTWKVDQRGQNRELKGQASFDPAKNVIALIAPELPPMVATVDVKDPAHFHFKAVGTPADDPGLDFAK